MENVSPQKNKNNIDNNSNPYFLDISRYQIEKRQKLEMLDWQSS